MSIKQLVPIQLPADPTQSLEAATKQYADLKVAKTGDTVTGNLIVSTAGNAWLGLNLRHANNPQLVFEDTAGTDFGYIQGQTAAMTISSAAGTVNLSVASVTKLVASATLLQASVPVALPADPASALHAATKQYVDGLASQTTLDARYVNVAGDSMSGTLAIAGPGIPGDCLRLIGGGSATIDFWNPPLSIKYASILGGSAGFTFSISAVAKLTIANTVVTSAVPIALPADPANALEAATKQYVDSKGGLNQATADTLYVNVTGDTMTAPLVLPASDPTLPEHAVRKAYVDWWYLPKAGGTMTGALTMDAGITLNPGMHLTVGGTITANQINVDAASWVYAPKAPTIDGHLTNKAYVDARQPYLVWTGTQAAFDAIATLDPNTHYYVVP